MTEQHDTVPAELRLSVAITQLIEPEQQHLDRDPAISRAALQALDDEHLAHIRELRQRHAGSRTPAARRRCIDAMTRAGFDHRTQRAHLEARLAEHTAVLPSLLEQLQDAVQSSTSSGGAPSAGPYRSPIGLAAAELLGHIERAVGHHHTCPLAHDVRNWQPPNPAEAADQAERWVSEIRGLLNPTRTGEAKASCPVCDSRHVWVFDPDRGERVRRAAIQLNYSTGTARCIAPGCTAYWSRDHLEHLERVLRHEAHQAG